MAARLRGYNGEEAMGGAHQRGSMAPPMIMQHNWRARVRGLEASNGLPGEGRLIIDKGRTRGNGRAGWKVAGSVGGIVSEVERR